MFLWLEFEVKIGFGLIDEVCCLIVVICMVENKYGLVVLEIVRFV